MSAKNAKVRKVEAISWLPILYRSPVKFCEEIISIEQQEAFAEVSVFASSDENFLVVRNDPGAIVAYLTVNQEAPFDEFKEIIDKFPKIHLQVSPEAFGWVKNSFEVYYNYTIRYYTIKPPIKESPLEITPPVRLTEEIPTVKEMILENPLLQISIEKGINYGYFEGEELVAYGGEDFVSDKLSIIAVWTDIKYRKKGLAFSCVKTAIKEILKTQRTPIYNCDVLNYPSIRIAEKIGFTPVCDFPCAYIGKWSTIRALKNDKAIPDSVFIS
ncbi:MAG: GNAT family N-acetyltransferase [Candidatus Kariarchaeaceae archaeon]